MASTKDVLDHHLKCFGDGDLKGILSDYAPEAALFTPDGPLRGADALRSLFQAMIVEFAKPGATFNLKRQSIEGDYAYLCGPQRLPTTSMKWVRTPSSCGTARSRPSRSPARLCPRAAASPDEA